MINKQALLLFNERVDRLDRTELAKRMANPHYRLDYERMMKREWISVDGVSEEDVDAFVLNVRLLIQNGPDRISIRSLAENVYSLPDVPVELRERFREAREDWQTYRDSESVFQVPGEQRNLLQGELFDVLLYGGLAHLNPDKVEQFRHLTRQGAASSIIFSGFMASLRMLLRTVRSIRDVNAELLQQETPTGAR